MKRTMAMLVMAVAFAATASAEDVRKGVGGAKADVFSFYGLQFGINNEEVKTIFPTVDVEGMEAKKPGHGMSFLTFVYDMRGRLTEIKASYPRSEDPLANEGLRRALKERYLNAMKFKNISVSLDEYSNRAGMTVIFIAVDLKEEIIEYFKQEALKKME